MIYTPELIAAALDYAVLKPTASREDVYKACWLALANNFASVCVRPCDVVIAVKTGAPICTVIGFPHGVNTTACKLKEAYSALNNGAIELDMVLNYSRLLEGDRAYVYREISRIRDCDLTTCLKVILETCYLTEEKIREACLIALDAGVDFVKTSTGFGTRGASVQDIITMKSALEDTGVKIKASGGIQTYADVAKYLDLGCTRVGSAKWVELLHE